MTAKAVAKRIKAKGLGRLRWYCQMCEKQCRDENGFKCHAQSAGHQRQLVEFAANPGQFISRFSANFRKDFLLVLRRKYGTSFVLANNVYQEYIKDKDHLHMNATKWTTLSEFVKELGREGYCRVEERDDGWWVRFLDRDAAEKDKRAREIDSQRMLEEERAEALLQRQLRAARDERLRKGIIQEEEERDDVDVADGPIALNLRAQERLKRMRELSVENVFGAADGDYDSRKESVAAGNGKKKKRRRSRWDDAPKLSAMEEIMRSEQKAAGSEKATTTMPTAVHERTQQADKPLMYNKEASEKEATPWLHKNIVVKIVNKEVGDGVFYGKKGTVVKVIEEFGARVSLLESEAVVELDQDDLETVIPKPGGMVLILKGPHRGSMALVKSLHIESYCVSLTLIDSGREISDVDYEDVSRAA